MLHHRALEAVLMLALAGSPGLSSAGVHSG